MLHKAHALTARWITFQQGSRYVGVSTRTLQNWEKTGGFRTANVSPCGTRGRRLIDRASLDKFIESFVGAPASEIVMNANRAVAP